MPTMMRPLYICPTPGTKRLSIPATKGSRIVEKYLHKPFTPEWPNSSKIINLYSVSEKLVNHVIDTEEKCHAGKDRERNKRSLAAVVVYLGDEVAGRYIKGYAGSEG